MVHAANLGYPRIGANRELKKLVEGYWAGKVSAAQLESGAHALRVANWRAQAAAGIDVIPSNDFAYYDQVLGLAVTFDVVPDLYRTAIPDPLDRYFAMGRGRQDRAKGIDVPAMEMKKWFDTNYHYIVPRFAPTTEFALATADQEVKPIREFLEAQAAGIHTRPVLLGPVSFLLLGRADKGAPADFSPLDLLDRLLPVYQSLLVRLRAAGATEIQLDEPALVLDLPPTVVPTALTRAYAALTKGPKIMVATYFGGIEHHLSAIVKLPIHALHIDLVRAPEQLAAVVNAVRPTRLHLSLGLIDGRNVWRTDLTRAIESVTFAMTALGADRVLIAPSCSLLHAPVNLAPEFAKTAPLAALPDVREWLAFADEKLREVALVAKYADAKARGETIAADVAKALAENQAAIAARRASPRLHNAAVHERVANLKDADFVRAVPFVQRYAAQQAHLHLPAFPTTTVGSFPQTKEVRSIRAQLKKSAITEAQYWAFVNAETEKCVRFQEEVGLDVLVHGEFERNDMVEYFGENLDGYAFTANAWVQSYGTRCVKPPIIFGDVARPKPMTVDMIMRAQGFTKKPLKGMLTGPITMLQWSFVRDDQPRRDTAYQLALAIRDEVVDLEKAGIRVIQIDEPAIREGLPLRRGDWALYLDWAVKSFRLATSGVRSETQIHSHMCYSDFADIFDAIAKLDVDVLSVEAAKSDLKLLAAFAAKDAYPNCLGPGLYDIHSPRVPSVAELRDRAGDFLARLPAARLWVNPDCGLKTRGWTEVRAALSNLVAIARELRAAHPEIVIAETPTTVAVTAAKPVAVETVVPAAATAHSA
ncbi:5-methyltetrahydropteroyltriglutamate-homocysteine S-methyltransferase [Allomyces macrogynus ATCC 38327]|uniref:5-methyltetrahydropteroyltriglutamate--homocysteine S-methyltransferase n=1 Tax=Allomyces macrogynus (strain ATCC 38327) TaxID=578462 RepID=A0A0L0T7E8_ALLM3|nr:5-methyltetrahydropteroyltriglutamate-homocysteine S-methyltransferase [Allomyces macrogynus ATCC 38327]|eukprot:KNE70738.1 5-methyltetrahydropteroyltriglutamate-homocysteine S-methyltransferase [Allomyces macrogynus ATCC 38327]